MLNRPRALRSAAMLIALLVLLAAFAQILRPSRSFELHTEAPGADLPRDPASIDWNDPQVLSEIPEQTLRELVVPGGPTILWNDDKVIANENLSAPVIAPAPAEPILLPPPDEAVMETANSGAGDRLEIIASRIFAGPGEVPPAGFLAYGILAFPERPEGATLARGMMFCEAFLHTIPHSSEIAVPVDSKKQEVVTVWPMRTRGQAAEANRIARSRTCEKAVPNYGLFEAQRHISAAIDAGIGIADARGPFLLAWAPGDGFPAPSARVLMADLSDVSSAGAARERFRGWMQQIQRREDFWNGLPWHERLRRTLRDAADTHGPAIWRGAKLMFGLKDEEKSGA